MVVKQMNEQVQQVNDLFLSGQVKESYQLAKEILGNVTAVEEEAYQVIQQHVAMLEANGYANMPQPTDDKVKQNGERTDGSYPERDVLAAYLGSRDDDQFGILFFCKDIIFRHCIIGVSLRF